MSESILDRARREYAAREDAARADERARARVVREASEASARRLAVHIFGTEPESVVWVLGVEAVWVFYDGFTLQYRGCVHSGPKNNWSGHPEAFYIIEGDCPECGVTTYRGSACLTWEDFCAQLVAGHVREQHAEDCPARPVVPSAPAPAPRVPTLAERLLAVVDEVAGSVMEGHVNYYHRGEP
jgi:hypothetical protein